MLREFNEVSIPQAVSTVATFRDANGNTKFPARFQYRKR